MKSQFLSIWFLCNIKLKLNSIHFSHTVAPLSPLVYYLLSISHLLPHLQPESLWSLLQVHCQKSYSKLQTVAYFSLEDNYKPCPCSLFIPIVIISAFILSNQILYCKYLKKIGIMAIYDVALSKKGQKNKPRWVIYYNIINGESCAGVKSVG